MPSSPSPHHVSSQGPHSLWPGHHLPAGLSPSHPALFQPVFHSVTWVTYLKYSLIPSLHHVKPLRSFLSPTSWSPNYPGWLSWTHQFIPCLHVNAHNFVLPLSNQLSPHPLPSAQASSNFLVLFGRVSDPWKYSSNTLCLPDYIGKLNC